MRPENPFSQGTMVWTIMEMSIQSEFDGKPGTADMTIKEIGEFLDIEPTKVRTYISRILLKTGYMVKYREIGNGRKQIS